MRIFKSGRMSMFFIVNAVSACIYVNKGGPCKWKHKKCFAHKIKTVVGRTHKKKKSRLSTRVIISGGTKTYSYLIISMLNIIFSKTVY